MNDKYCMEHEYIKLLLSWGNKVRSNKAANHTGIFTLLEERYPGVPINIQIHSFIKNVSPYCVVCNEPVKHPGKQTCSIACRTIHSKTYSNTRVEKQKQTLLDRYGVSNIRNMPGSKEKRNSTMMDKYGALVSDKAREATRNRSDNLNLKGRETLMKNYGVTNPGQISDHGDKCKATKLKHLRQTINQ